MLGDRPHDVASSFALEGVEDTDEGRCTARVEGFVDDPVGPRPRQMGKDEEACRGASLRTNRWRLRSETGIPRWDSRVKPPGSRFLFDTYSTMEAYTRTSHAA